MKTKYTIDYKGLENYLLGLSYAEIETYCQKPKKAKLIAGHSIQDIEYFKMDSDKYPENSIISHGEPFLVDALGNDLSVVILTKRKYKLPNGRVINIKLLNTLISDCRSIYGTPLNGYWKIPSQFITLNAKQ